MRGSDFRFCRRISGSDASNLVVSFLVRESVGRGSYDGFVAILVRLDDDDLCISVPFLLGALDQAIGNKCEDPQHPEENPDTTACTRIINDQNGCLTRGTSDMTGVCDLPRTNATARPSQGPRAIRAK